MMGALAITSPLRPAQRHMLRQLNERDGEFVAFHRKRELIDCAALLQAGYAEKHTIFPHRYRITPQGEYYLDRLARAD